jgi:hypothetical protein
VLVIFKCQTEPGGSGWCFSIRRHHKLNSTTQFHGAVHIPSWFFPPQNSGLYVRHLLLMWVYYFAIFIICIVLDVVLGYNCVVENTCKFIIMFLLIVVLFGVLNIKSVNISNENIFCRWKCIM